MAKVVGYVCIDELLCETATPGSAYNMPNVISTGMNGRAVAPGGGGLGVTAIVRFAGSHGSVWSPPGTPTRGFQAALSRVPAWRARRTGLSTPLTKELPASYRP